MMIVVCDSQTHRQTHKPRGIARKRRRRPSTTAARRFQTSARTRSGPTPSRPRAPPGSRPARWRIAPTSATLWVKRYRRERAQRAASGRRRRRAGLTASGPPLGSQIAARPGPALCALVRPIDSIENVQLKFPALDELNQHLEAHMLLSAVDLLTRQGFFLANATSWDSKHGVRGHLSLNHPCAHGTAVLNIYRYPIGLQWCRLRVFSLQTKRSVLPRKGATILATNFCQHHTRAEAC